MLSMKSTISFLNFSYGLSLRFSFTAIFSFWKKRKERETYSEYWQIS